MNVKELFLFRLLSATDIGAIRFFRLLARFGDTKSILKASKRDLMSVEGIGPAITDTIFNSSNSSKAD